MDLNGCALIVTVRWKNGRRDETKPVKMCVNKEIQSR